MPGLLVLAMLAVTLMMQKGKIPTEAYLPMVLFLSALTLFALTISYLLHFVYLTDETVSVKRYYTEVPYPRDAIKSIHSVLVLLNVLETHDGKKYLFLSRLAQMKKELPSF